VPAAPDPVPVAPGTPARMTEKPLQAKSAKVAEGHPARPRRRALRSFPRGLEGHFEGGRVAPLLDGDDGLPGHAEPVGQLCLRHLPVREAERADGVGDPGRHQQDWNPRAQSKMAPEPACQAPHCTA
jgi:hypothetical protein